MVAKPPVDGCDIHEIAFTRAVPSFEWNRALQRRTHHVSVVIENSRTEIALPKHGPTDGADSIPE